MKRAFTFQFSAAATVICALLAAALLCVLPALAQQKRVSPHETISAVIDGNRVTVVYGRPFSKDPKSDQIRKIWGTLVPYDKPWRMGADEATLLITQMPIAMGETTIPAGAYTLYFLPVENGPSKLIVNKQLGQWGMTYDEKQDFARINADKQALDPPASQFTMAVERNPSGGGSIKLMWESTQFVIPFTVKK
jgi:hypothetical protein